MAPRSVNHTYISVQLSNTEKQVLDDAVEAAGVSRNRFIRMWIASLAAKKP